MKRIERSRVVEVFYSLRTQLILYFMVISIVFLVIGTYYSYRCILDMLKKNNEKYILQQFSQVDYNIKNIFNDIDKLSRLFLIDDNVQEFLQDNYTSTELNELDTKRSIFYRISQYISNYDYINSIYIFTENKGGIGGNESYSKVVRASEESIQYFSSGLYQKVSNNFPKIVLGGGITEEFFSNRDSDQKTYIISIARGIKPINEPSRSATLIFNINERYIASMYASSVNNYGGYMYIIDNNGKVISNSDGRNIGNTYAMFDRIDTNKDYGSFTANDSSIPIQRVYYKLKNTGWYMVSEIPMDFFTKDINQLQKILVFVFLFIFIAISIVSFFWLRKLIKPLNLVVKKMLDISKGNLGLTFSKIPKNEFGTVIRQFNEMSLSISNLIKKNNEVQEEKSRLEIEFLQSQINPHFLYNTLNMIKWMAMDIKARDIVDSIVALGNMLKPIFKSSDTIYTLREELDYLENYIRITNWRFSSRIVFKVNIEERFWSFKVPRLIMQPIIENCITHGKHKQDDTIDIIINLYEEENIINILISDSGVGIEPKRLEDINASLSVNSKSMYQSTGEGIGLYNVNRRIFLNLGEAFGIRLRNAKVQGTDVIVKLPKIL